MPTIDRAMQELFKVTGKGVSGLFGGWRSTVETAGSAVKNVGATAAETNIRTAEGLERIANNASLNRMEKFGLTQARRADGALEVGTDIITDAVSGVAQIGASAVGAVANAGARVAVETAKFAGEVAWGAVSSIAQIGVKVATTRGGGYVGKAVHYTGKTAVQVGGLAAVEAGKGAVDLAKLVYHTRNSRAVQMGATALGIGVIFPAAAELGGHEAEYNDKLYHNTQQRSPNGGGTFIRDTKPIGKKDIVQRQNGLLDAQMPEMSGDLGNDLGNVVFALHNLRHGG
jgi:hypothetical protein